MSPSFRTSSSPRKRGSIPDNQFRAGKNAIQNPGHEKNPFCIEGNFYLDPDPELRESLNGVSGGRRSGGRNHGIDSCLRRNDDN